ncbi:MAG: M23 family metallopeptidase [Deltaproteobacteria bacterium]|nr:M23 family metallopeptidase [Deltaproteobacteria bacterium]
MRAALAVVALIILLLIGGAWWLKCESQRPYAALVAKVEALGRKTPFDIDVHAGLPGLRSVSVRLLSGTSSYELLTESYPPQSWRGSLLADKRLHIESDLNELRVPEGPVTLVVTADTYAWHLWSSGAVAALNTPLTLDLTPPLIAPLTTQHNIRLGGVDMVVFRQSPDTVSSGVEVGKYFFPATTGYFADSAVALALFAVPQDLDLGAEPRLVARDAAGNRREVALACSIAPQRFAERTLSIDDAFLTRKVPDLERLNGLPTNPNLVEGYLQINRDLRLKDESRLHEITATSAPEPLWNGAFHRQSNAAPLSSFADRRTYLYRGDVIDHQTHLGYDLASLKLAPVEAAQNGKVVFADNLGIYGNTVVLDHGLGIFSLYGHLSTIAVHVGDPVGVKQTLGQTGETGLAGGDHLHFSIMLHGIHVDPVEWWDAHWLRDHVTSKLALFPRAGAQKAGQQR